MRQKHTPPKQAYVCARNQWKISQNAEPACSVFLFMVVAAQRRHSFCKILTYINHTKLHAYSANCVAMSIECVSVLKVNPKLINKPTKKTVKKTAIDKSKDTKKSNEDNDSCRICIRMTGIGAERICGMCRFEARVRNMSLDQYREARKGDKK